MTTRVPDGVSDQTVNEVRAREAANSRKLAEQGVLLRLFRPPLQPGEWRTLGLFAADDDVRLEQVLAAMPLRVWRTDEVTPLGPHPNDFRPSNPAAVSGPEFLVTFTAAIPEGAAEDLVDERNAQERDSARRYAEQGHLERLWTLPGAGRALGLWRARDADEMQAVLTSLPLADWLEVDTVQLDVHPSDPALSHDQSSC